MILCIMNGWGAQHFLIWISEHFQYGALFFFSFLSSIVFGISRSSLNLDWVPHWMFSRLRNPIIYSTKPIILQLSKSWSIMCYKIFQHWDFLSLCGFHYKSLTWFIKSKYKLAFPTPPPGWNLQTAFQTHMWESLLLGHLIKTFIWFHNLTSNKRLRLMCWKKSKSKIRRLIWLFQNLKEPLGFRKESAKNLRFSEQLFDCLESFWKFLVLY